MIVLESSWRTLCLVGSDDADDDALDLAASGCVYHDGFVVVVGGLESDLVAFSVEEFECRFIAVDDGDHGLAVACGVSFFTDDEVAISDLLVDHGVATDFEDKFVGWA